MRTYYEFLACLLTASFVGALDGEANSDESETGSDQLTDRSKRQNYFVGIPNQGSYQVPPPLSPAALLSGGPPSAVIKGILAFHTRLQGRGPYVGGINQAGLVLSPQSDILAAHLPSQSSNNVGHQAIGRCSGRFPCVPLVHCAPFFEEIRANNLACPVYRDAIGACCRFSQQGIVSASPMTGFSDVPANVVASFSPGVAAISYSSEQLAFAMQQSVANLVLRDGINNALVEKGVVLTDPQRPAFGHLQFFKTSEEAMKIARAALVQIDAALSLQTQSSVADESFYASGSAAPPIRIFSAVNTQLSSTCPTPPYCGKKDIFYRRSDGSCNNMYNPGWGQARTAFGRIVPPRYADGTSAPRRSVTGRDLPSARLVSTANVPDVDNPSAEYSLAVMQWGQFIDHDLTHAPIFRFDNETGIECCDEEGQLLPANLRHPECFPISIPKYDPFFKQFGRRCMNFVRSMPAPLKNCTGGYREQMNQVTHFLDGSAVYGSSEEELNELREEGENSFLLKTQGRGLLPPDRFAREEDCFLAGTGLNCFRAGDSRVNEQPHLSVIHTVWVRQHNRIARKLAKANPKWTPEVVFQETRKIVTAQIQHIIYNEWLPLVLGTNTAEMSGLLPQRKGHTFTYNKFLDSSIRNEFATVAFRFGHTLVQGMLRLFDKYHKNNENVDLFRHFNRPRLVYQSRRIDQILRGLSKQPMQSFDNFVVDDLTNRLFQTDTTRFGMDLIALNTQRGRDHGIPSYNDLREACGLPRARSFNDLQGFIRPKTLAVFRELYEHVDDIDAFVAGLSEFPFNGGIVGPLFNCIIRDQFARLKFGDRFYYENGGMPSSFTKAQLKEIRKTSWAEIICSNGEHIKHIQPLALRLPGPNNPKVPCSSPAIPKPDCKPWIQDMYD